MNHTLLSVSWVLLFVFVAMIVVMAVLLLVVRASRDGFERRADERSDAIRGLLFDALMGDEPESEVASAELRSRSGNAWTRLEDQAFGLLPKIKGDSRATLVSLLLDQGAAERAIKLTHAWSAVRRCRGAFDLGALGQREHVGRLIEMLEDRHFLVRRVSVRALGNLRDPSAVIPLLRVSGEDPRLTRDLVFALDRIGPSAAGPLREEVRLALDPDSRAGEHADLAIVVLGHIGDVAAVPLLSAALDDQRLIFATSAAEALGRIGSPESIPALVKALVAERAPVRRSAAQALGAVGSPLAIDSLLDVVEENDPEVSRQAAESLVRLEHAGLHVLRESTSPYAVEALAFASLREPA